jgi:hypothetical protein
MPVYKQPTSAYWLIEFWLGGQRYRRSARTTSKRKAIDLEWQWRKQLAEQHKRQPLANLIHLTRRHIRNRRK